jgi:predicted nucleic-acid-binding protein
MIGLDTNVVVRYLVKDDPAQSAVAVRLIRSLSVEDPGFLAIVVMAEIVWVLESAYKFEKSELVDVIQGLLGSKEIVLENAELVSQSIRLFEQGNADFSDYLIERSGRAAGCLHTFTFDQEAAASGGMQLLN